MVKVYVNWNKREVLTEDEYKELREQKTRNLFDDEDEFKDWLNSDYSASEIFEMTAEERLEIQKRWDDYCINEIQDNLDYEWDEIDLDVD
jgi:uncharacterized protein YeeX (DUF496 family)